MHVRQRRGEGGGRCGAAVAKTREELTNLMFSVPCRVQTDIDSRLQMCGRGEDEDEPDEMHAKAPAGREAEEREA